MSSYIKSQQSSRRVQRHAQKRERTRGTAITETLLIFIPVWTFFVMTMQVLQYWEGEYIDHSIEMENEFARQTNTTLLFDLGYKADAENPANKGVFKFYSKKVEDSDHPGPTAQKNPKLPRRYFYITDQKGRKIVVYRGTSSWVPFIWLRGQHFGSEENDRRKKWFEDMGNSVINENREPLQLGS